MALNPMATAVQAFRTVLLGTMGLGWALFRRLRPAFADEL